MTAKRKTTDITAFITNVSPRKAKSVRLTLQVGANETKKAILFDMKKLPALQDKKLAGEPVKILNCIVDKPSNANFAEVVINTRSTVMEPNPNGVKFERREPLITVTKIADIDETCIN